MKPTKRINPITLLLYSRKFWLLVANTTVTLMLYFVSKYWPELKEDLQFIISAITVPFLTVITAITVEDINRKQ